MARLSAPRLLLLAGFASLSALASLARDASACGGCFTPPEPDQRVVGVVTDHRMVLAVGRESTTLYDQLRFTGSPGEFAWVLPIHSDVEVGLSSDGLFAGLDAVTQVSVRAPPKGCPAPPSDCGGSSGFGCATTTSTTSASGDAGAEAPVTVTRQEVVGPYATVQLQSEDPEALSKWLTDNGYSLPASAREVVKRYVAEHFNFLALKLRPGVSVRAMRPIRVTSPGPAVVLPLRMVAVGAGANVGITLWVVAEGRYQPQNFPWFQVNNEDLVWRWATSDSNFKEVRQQKSAAHGGRGWELEASVSLQNGTFPRPAAAMGPTPTALADGYVASGQKTEAQMRLEDLGRLYDDRGSGTSRVTRLRADLANNALAEDLVLFAAEQGFVPKERQALGEEGEPSCPVWVDCEFQGNEPRSIAIGRSDASCSTAGTALPNEVWAGALVALVGVGLQRRRRSVSRRERA